MISAIAFSIVAIAGVLIAWFCKRTKAKRTKPEAATKAGPGDTGTGTGSPR